MDNPINKRVDKMNGEQLDFPPNGLSIDLLRAVYRNPSIPLPVIPDGLQVLHKCDVPRCINPVHLFLGTQQNNIDDMLAKGGYRPWRGGRPRFIMPEQVAKMAMLRRQGHSYASIGAMFYVSGSAVRQRLNNPDYAPPPPRQRMLRRM